MANKRYFVVEMFKLINEDEYETHRWGHDTDEERDDTLTNCLVDPHKADILMMVDVDLETGDIHTWYPSQAYRDDLIRKYNELDADDERPISGPPAQKATHMWPTAEPYMEQQRLRSLGRQIRTEHGDDD